MTSGDTIMNVSNVGYSQHGYTKLAPRDPETKLNQAQVKQPSQEITKEISGDKAVKQVKGETPASNVEAFTYGALGMDHPDEVKSNDDDAYMAGQVLSALGTIGAILAIVV